MPRLPLAFSLLALALAGCGGGGGSQGAEIAAQQGGGAVPTSSATPTAAVACDGACADTPTRLTAAEVKQVIGQVAAEAEARNLPGTIAVVDRVGNVLAVYAMDGADRLVTVTSTADGSAPVRGGLESVNIIPAELAAIAKAVTGAYLSTEGNAFTTRTASQIVQENFNPGEFNQPSGPLFG
ncbi:MAG: heme-binding protein, partial [Pseudomonadales bacterium]|nr:heme-binding protein [Pseudomonadales bacterium]